MASICYGCIAGIHEECNDFKLIEDTQNVYATCCCWSENVEGTTAVPPGPVSAGNVRGPGRPQKEQSDIKDQESTGRKRAVVELRNSGRIEDGMVCEWAGLRNAGGGPVPLVGCSGTVLRTTKSKDDCGPGESPVNVHHGPDKSTLNNSQENLHAICSTCHNRWHGLNDKHYAKERPSGGQPHIPLSGELRAHDPETMAGPKALEYNSAFWDLPPKVRPKVPYLVPREEDDND